MSAKDSFPDINSYLVSTHNTYNFQGTQFQPASFARQVRDRPNGGEHIYLVWNYDQALDFFHNSPFYCLVLCLNESSMQMRYCDSAVSAQEFYSPKRESTPQEKAELAYQDIQRTQEANRNICELGVCIHEEHQK